ncbi:hypothetical protein [Nisaea sediminum]|uniref:hypothetical protein n=1 Tax=Nisaea sediminum TaxID=2775867 RepID=UPI0018664F1B|nr:hypothetical protein [Nisaea sediminum]
MIEILFLLTAAGIFAAIMLGPAARSETWRAMVAPLASIIGSGFLVSAPLLGHEFGGLAIGGIALLCAMSWAIGGAVRYNIAYVEPMLESGQPPRHVAILERLSTFVLFFAYVISVAYYLALLGAFVIKLVAPGADPVAAKGIATALLALIGWLGWSGGLKRVIAMESTVVVFKLAIIGGFLAALAAFNIEGVLDGRSVLPPAPRGDLASLPVLLGMLIMVQGFETSRFIGEEFGRQLRVRTMRYAQLAATAIYLVFFALLGPLMNGAMSGKGETAIMDAAAIVAPLLPIGLTLGAIASQFSAAVADAIGGAGLAHDATRRLNGHQVYPLFVFVSALVLWETDIYGVIVLASRAFAVYYMLQCLVAAVATARNGHAKTAIAARLALALLCAAVAIFGVPAE